MAYSNYGLNQRVNNLYALLNDGTIETGSNLAHILENGNSAGTTDIDMNQQDIINGNEVFLGSNGNTIELNGGGSSITITDNLGNQNVITALGSSLPSANADSVLTTATTSNAIFYPTFLGATSGYNSIGVSTALTFNPSTKEETITDGVNSTTITPTSITTGTLNYTTLNPAIPTPPTPTLDDVLNAGNTAQNDLYLNSSPATTTSIQLLPTLNAPEIILTDGTTTNTINKNGYTTRNSVQNLTHYLNFSDSSSTGTGSIQKTAGIECNPSTKTITATTFVGALSGNATSATTATTATNATNVTTTATTSNSTFYPTFVSATSGNNPINVDTTFTYNPSTDTLTATTFVGSLSGTATSSTTATTATNATNVATTATTTNATYYPTFVSATSGNNPINVDTTFTYNPSTDTLTATTFAGTATNSTNSAITATTTNATYYPTFVSATSGNNPINVDTSLTYNPSTDTLTNGAGSTIFTTMTPSTITLQNIPSFTTTITASSITSPSFVGTATNATNAVIGTDNASTLVYPTFVKTSGAGNKGLFIDDTTTPLTYNASTGALTATSYFGSGANLTGVVATGLNNQNPTSVTAGGSSTPTTLTSGRLNLVAISSPSNNYCILPTATSGTSISVFNQSSTLTLNIFPPSGQAIDLGATNGFITINPYSCIDLVYSSNWLSQRPSYASQVYYYYPNVPSSNYPSSVYNLINATGYDYSGGGVQTNSFARMTTGGRQLEVGNYEGNSGYECYTQYDATNSQLTQLSSSGGGGFSRLSASLFAVGVYTPTTYTTRVSLDCSTTGAITQIPNATTTYAGTSTKNTLYQGINVVGSISSNQTLTSTNYFLVNIYTPSTAGLNIILPTATGVNSGTWIIIKNQSATQTLTIQYNPTPTTLATLAPYTTSANVVSSYKFIVGGGVWYVISG